MNRRLFEALNDANFPTFLNDSKRCGYLMYIIINNICKGCILGIMSVFKKRVNCQKYKSSDLPQMGSFSERNVNKKGSLWEQGILMVQPIYMSKRVGITPPKKMSLLIYDLQSED